MPSLALRYRQQRSHVVAHTATSAWHGAERLSEDGLTNLGIGAKYAGQAVSVAGKAIGKPISEIGGELLKPRWRVVAKQRRTPPDHE